jgi:predicted DsbA family dithiol-disulfide isomerase
MSRDQSARALEQVAEGAAKNGLFLDLSATRVVNTVLAHQLIHLASGVGRQRATKDALYRAYFQRGRNLASLVDLVAIAREVGLDEDEARDALETQVHLPRVRADERRAESLGITAVPYLLIDDTYALRGAQPRQTIEHALTLAGVA